MPDPKVGLPDDVFTCREMTPYVNVDILIELSTGDACSLGAMTNIRGPAGISQAA